MSSERASSASTRPPSATGDSTQYALAFGELLWDELPSGRVLGGAPGNFAYRLSTFGIRTFVVTRVGNDPLGREATSAIKALGVSTDLIQIDPARPTGTVKVKLDSKGNPSFTIIPEVAYDYMEMSNHLAELAPGACLLYFGSLAQRSSVSRGLIAQLIEKAPQAIKFFDVNLRKDCYTKEVLEESLRKSTIVKLNHEELQRLKEFFNLTGENIDEVAASLQEAFSIQTVLVTMAERGAFALTSGGERIYVPGYSVAVVDTIGSGDAFSAAFCSAILNGSPLKAACSLGNKLGALVAKTQGATSAISLHELEAFGRGEQLNTEPSLSKFL